MAHRTEFLTVPVMLARQTKEGQRLLDGFLNPGGQARIADRPFSQPRGEIGLRLIKVAAIIEPSKLLQAIVAMFARQVIEGVPEEMHVGAVEEPIVGGAMRKPPTSRFQKLSFA